MNKDYGKRLSFRLDNEFYQVDEFSDFDIRKAELALLSLRGRILEPLDNIFSKKLTMKDEWEDR